MPSYILKIEDRYFDWSTIVDAPTSEPMTVEEYRAHYQRLHGSIGMDRLDARLRRTDEKGTSAMDYDSWEDVVRGNRAGPDESELPLSSFVEWVRQAKEHKRGADDRGGSDGA